MEIKKMGILFLGLILFVGERLISVGALSVDYYAKSCSAAEGIVRRTVHHALRNDRTVSAGLLRMHFHDCFVRGCDGSVLLDSTKGNVAEKDSVPNQSLHGFDVIDLAKEEIEGHCKGVVSCSDIVAMAARDAVYLTGGPCYDVPKGRKDGIISKAKEALNLLPPPSLHTTDLIGRFGQLGFTVKDMVALSGGHTLGVSSCASFKNRLSNFSTTSAVDPTLNRTWARMLSKICANGDKSVAPFDWSRYIFDNAYFKALQVGGGLLTSDQTLFTDKRTKGIVDTFAADQRAFFRDFSIAMGKMGALGATTSKGNGGQVRLNCRRIN